MTKNRLPKKVAAHNFRGKRLLVSKMTIAARLAAMVARPKVTNHGLRSATARLVAGTVAPKIVTPQRPSRMPLIEVSEPLFTDCVSWFFEVLKRWLSKIDHGKLRNYSSERTESTKLSK